jgi:hypothetical protein
MTGGVSVEELLSSMYEALSSIPHTVKQQQQINKKWGHRLVE